MKKLRLYKKAKRKPYRPHCKLCKIRLMVKDFCRGCWKHVCPSCGINHYCPDMVGG